jgi:cation:H+ antiporter
MPFELNLTLAIIIFVASSLVIAFAGSRLTTFADRLADLTGIGEALMGAVFLGVITSLSGIVTSVSAAYQNHPELSVSNAVGGIAFQTVFLAIADMFYRKANLEHASASLTNVLQSIMLILLLSFIMMMAFMKEFTIFNIHPGSILLIIFYLIIQRMISKVRKDPMWDPVDTEETNLDIADEDAEQKWNMTSTIIRFVIFAILIVFAGYFIMQSAVYIADNTGLSASLMGAVFTSLSTSLPELMVTVSAVRQNALALAVGNIIGGNTFDVLFISFSDVAYRQGSIFHAFNDSHFFIFTITIIMTAILSMGLLYRQRHGFAGIGWESLWILLVFLGGYTTLFFMF